jgi:hypothetical protein
MKGISSNKGHKEVVRGPYKTNKRASDDEKLREHLQKSDHSQNRQNTLQSEDTHTQGFKRSEEMVELFQKLKEGTFPN